MPAEAKSRAPYQLAGNEEFLDYGKVPATSGSRPQVGDRGRDSKLLLAIGVITLAGAVLRFATLSQSVWFDEAGTVLDVSRSFSHLLHTVTHDEPSPPLYFAGLWLWRHLFGSSAVDMRTLSALAGTLTIPVAFFVALRLVGRRAAVIVAVLVASSPTMVYYSQELRMYALLVFLCALGFWAFLVALQTPRTRNLALWAAASTFALLTHYFAALVIAPQATALIVHAWRSNTSRRPTAISVSVVGSVGLGLVALLKYEYGHSYTTVQRFLTSPFVFQPFTARTAASGNGLRPITQDLLVGPGGPAKKIAGMCVLWIVLGSMLLLSRYPTSRARRGAVFALMLTVPATVVVPVFLIFHLPIQGRYLLPLWLPAAVAVGCGLASIRDRRIGLVATATLCAIWLGIAISAVTVPQFASREDSRGAARTLGVAATTRLIAIDQRWDLLPLGLYRPNAQVYRHALAQVRELDVIAMPKRGFPSGSDANPPSPPAAIRNVPHLRLRQIIHGGTYIVERYISPSPVSIRIDPGGGIFSSAWRFLYERPGSGVGSL